MDLLLLAEVVVTMAVIMDPIGNVPIFLAVTRRFDARTRRMAAVTAVGAATAVIFGFAVAGQWVLDRLGVSVPALQGAGGLLLLLVALELLTDDAHAEAAEPEPGDHVAVAMVPLATPLLAGPGAIVATIVFVSRSEGPSDLAAIALGIAAVLVVVLLALRYADVLNRILGRSAILLLSRVAGLLLAAIAVQMLADAIVAFARTV